MPWASLRSRRSSVLQVRRSQGSLPCGSATWAVPVGQEPRREFAPAANSRPPGLLHPATRVRAATSFHEAGSLYPVRRLDPTNHVQRARDCRPAGRMLSEARVLPAGPRTEGRVQRSLRQLVDPEIPRHDRSGPPPLAQTPPRDHPDSPCPRRLAVPSHRSLLPMRASKAHLDGQPLPAPPRTHLLGRRSRRTTGNHRAVRPDPRAMIEATGSGWHARPARQTKATPVQRSRRELSRPNPVRSPAFQRMQGPAVEPRALQIRPTVQLR
jgi:hypothetical protein